MATLILRPSSDASINFGTSPSWSRVDDPETQPATALLDGAYASAGGSDDGLNNTYNATTTGLTGTAADLKIWLYNGPSSSSPADWTVRPVISGTPLSDKTIDAAAANSWSASGVWSGAWDLAALIASAQISIDAPTGIGKSDEYMYDAIYLEVTYTTTLPDPGATSGLKAVLRGAERGVLRGVMRKLVDWRTERHICVPAGAI